MAKCFIKGCNSEKNVSLKNVSYFKFPLHDEILLKKWLEQIKIQEWKPTASHQICSIHFRSEDIDYHPNRVNPFLKPTAIPTIFPDRCAKTTNNNPQNCQENINKKQNNLPLGTLKTTNNKTDSSTSRLHSGPLILIPTTNKNPQNFNQNFLQLPAEQLLDCQKSVIPSNLSKLTVTSKPQVKKMQSSPQKLRKILPKPEIYTLPRSSIETLPPLTRNRALLHPDILIVPGFHKSAKNSLGKSNPISLSPSVKKRPVLHITINKKHERSVLNQSSCMNSNEKEKIDSENLRDDGTSIKNIDDTRKEITIENASTNKSVTFKLDPTSGEIVVTTHRLNSTLTDINVEKKQKNERKKRKNLFGDTAGTNLHDLHRKAEEDCNILRKRLKTLRDQYKEEQEEIQKLQDHLTVLGNKVQKSCDDFSDTRESERKAIIESDYDYERLLLQVNEIKEDIKKTRKSVSSKKTKEIMENRRMNNETLQSIAKEGGPFNLKNSSDGEIVGEIIDDIDEDNCDDLGTKIDKELLELTESSESEDENCNAEFLDSEFINT